MRQRTFLPAHGWLENFYLLLKYTCPKHIETLEVTTSTFNDLHGPLKVYNVQNILRSPIMRQRTILPAHGLLENFHLLLKYTCPKHIETVEVPTSIFEDLLRPSESIYWTKHPGKPNHEAENFFAYPGLVGELFSVAQIHMFKAQRDIGSAHKHL